MEIKMTKSRLSLMGFFMFFAFGTGIQQAYAYIPPSQFILKNWAAMHARAKVVRVKVKIQNVEAGRNIDPPLYFHLIYESEPQLVHTWVTQGPDINLYATERRLDQCGPLLQTLLADNSIQLGMALKEKGIPVFLEPDLLKLSTEEERRKAEKLSLMRISDGIAWVIGRNESGKNLPRIAFKKDSFLPVFISVKVGSAHLFQETRIETFRFIDEYPFPRALEYWRDGKAILHWELVEFAVDQGKSHHPIHIPSLSNSANGVMSAAGQAAGSAVQRLIMTFYEGL